MTKKEITALVDPLINFRPWVKSNYGYQVGAGLWNHSLQYSLILNIIQHYLRAAHNTHVNPYPISGDTIKYFVSIMRIDENNTLSYKWLQDPEHAEVFNRMGLAANLICEDHTHALEEGIKEAINLISSTT